MLLFFAGLAFTGAIAILPGWYYASKRARQTPWCMCLPACGITMWVLLTMFGIGAQSLANLTEVLQVSLFSVLVAYADLFLPKRSTKHSVYRTVLAFVFVLSVAVVFRVFTPHLPE
jgi:hypothetical protein